MRDITILRHCPVEKRERLVTRPSTRVVCARHLFLVYSIRVDTEDERGKWCVRCPLIQSRTKHSESLLFRNTRRSRWSPGQGVCLGVKRVMSRRSWIEVQL